MERPLPQRVVVRVGHGLQPGRRTLLGMVFLLDMFLYGHHDCPVIRLIDLLDTPENLPMIAPLV